jgi:hypothetical protein
LTIKFVWPIFVSLLIIKFKTVRNTTKLVICFESNNFNKYCLTKKVKAEFWVTKNAEGHIILDRNNEEIKETLKEMFKIFKGEECRIDIYSEYNGQILYMSQQRFLVSGLNLQLKKGIRDDYYNYPEFVNSNKKEFFNVVALCAYATINFAQGNF